MAEVMAAENVMSQSLFDDPGAGPLGGALDRLAEGQEELRGELGVFAERFEALEHRILALDHDRSAERAELESTQSRALEVFSSGRRRRDRTITYLAIGAAILAMLALGLSLMP
jgi:hypothetical protein